MAFFDLRHSDYRVHWRLPYHVAACLVALQIIWIDNLLLEPLELRLRNSRPGSGVKAGDRDYYYHSHYYDGDGDGGWSGAAAATASAVVETKFETLRLLKAWEWRIRLRAGVPMLAGGLCLAAFVFV